MNRNFSYIMVRFCSLRFVIVLVIWTLILDDFISAYRAYALQEGLRDSFFLLPFLQTNQYFMKVVRLAALCFYANAPFMEKSEMYVLQRMGKARWGMYNIIYLFISGIVLTVCLNVISMLLILPVGTFQSEWGSLLRTISVEHNIAGGIFEVDSVILNHFSPAEVSGMQFLMDMASFVLLGLLLYVLSLFVHRVLAYVITIAVLMLPSVVGWTTNLSAIYFSPFSWLEMGNWRIGYDLTKPDFIYIFCGYTLLIMLFILIGQWKVKKVDWQDQEG